MPISITADAFVLTLSGRVTLSHYPPSPRDTSLDQTYDCANNQDQGVLVLTMSLLGDSLSRRWSGGPLTITLGLDWGVDGGGGTLPGLLLSSGDASKLVITTALLHSYGFTQSAGVGEHAGANMLRWSKIGNLDFTIDRSNLAGQMPMPWKGTVYQILRRGQNIVVYGKNGVASLVASDTAFGSTPVLKLGIKSKLAVCDTGDAHYFVDRLNRLWRLTDSLEMLDYREWLGTLSSTIALAYNPDTKLLYIGDGTLGYVYNTETASMGKGPGTITGVGLQDSTLYVVASGAMTIPNFTIKTDIYDMGSRHGKSIRSLEASLDTTIAVDAAIDWRLQKQSAFKTTAWHRVDSRGLVFIPCYGYEFRFLFRAATAGVFHLDELQVNGVIHAH